MATSDALASERTFGRSAELAAGRQLIEDTAAGRGSALFIEGEPGAGKSHLLHRWAEAARLAGLNARSGRARELEHELPFALMTEAVGIAAGDQLHEIVETIAGLVETWSSERPVLFLLDDLQWADSASLIALARVLRQSAVLPVSVIGSLRRTPRSEGLETILEARDAQRVNRMVIGPLAPDAVAQLVASLTGVAPGPRLLEQTRRCGGNPLYVRELVGALGREAMLHRTDDGIEVDVASSTPPEFRMLVLRHLSVLPPETVNLVRIASVLGSRFALADLSLVTGRPATELAATLRPALDAGLLNGGGPLLAFQHDLVRDAVYEDLGRALAAGLHAQAGEALARAGRSALEVAPHYAASSSGIDPVAAEWLRRAGREAAVRDPQTAVTLLEQAAARSAEGDGLRDRVDLALGEALAAAGRLAEAEAKLRARPLTSDDRELAAHARASLAQVLHLQARFGEAATQLEIASRDLALSAALRARLFCQFVLDLVWHGDVAGAESNLQEALDRGRNSGDRLAAFYALMAAAAVARARGRLCEAVALSLDAGPIVAAVSQEDEISHLEMPPVSYLIDVDRFDEAEAILASAPAWSEERGGAARPMRHHQQLRCEFYRGHWDDAIVEADLALALSDQSGSAWARGKSHAFLLLIGVGRGDRRRIETSLRALAGASECFELIARAAATAPGADLVLALEAVTPPPPSFEMAAARDLGIELTRLQLLVGDRSAAEIVADRMQAAADRASCGSLAAAAILTRGMLESDPALLLESVERFRSTPRAVDLAVACEEAGRATGSVSLLREALGLYEAFGADHLAARVVARLRALGIRSGRGGARRRPATGWDSLTATERRVAEMVAGGLLYKEIAARLFISRRTVETHVVHVFGKVGVNSRVELARLVRQHLGQDLE